MIREASVYLSACSSSKADSTPCEASIAVQSVLRPLTAANAAAPSSLAPAGERRDGVCTAAGTVLEAVSAPTLSYVPLRLVGSRHERRQQAKQRARERQHPPNTDDERRQPTGDCNNENNYYNKINTRHASQWIRNVTHRERFRRAWTQRSK